MNHELLILFIGINEYMRSCPQSEKIKSCKRTALIRGFMLFNSNNRLVISLNSFLNSLVIQGIVSAHGGIEYGRPQVFIVVDRDDAKSDAAAHAVTE